MLTNKKEAEEMRRAAEGAIPFEPSSLSEKLIKMRVEKPESCASMSPATVLALGYYEAAKRKAAMLER